jgi:hypothetical protein
MEAIEDAHAQAIHANSCASKKRGTAVTQQQQILATNNPPKR